MIMTTNGDSELHPTCQFQWMFEAWNAVSAAATTNTITAAADEEEDFSSHHIQALCLAAASSTDNLLVGLSVGLSGKPLPNHVLWGISVCNAAGCWLATSAGGQLLNDALAWMEHVLWGWLAGGQRNHDNDNKWPPQGDENNIASSSCSVIQYLLAAGAFAYLAWQEYQEQQQQQQQEKTKQHTPTAASLRLALPMTLNNLAGGVTGGVLGLSPALNASYALLVSVVTMYTGFVVGRQVGERRQEPSRESNETEVSNEETPAASYYMAKVSIALYLLLSLQSFYEAANVAKD